MNCALLQPKVQAYIIEHLQADVQQLVLKGVPFENVTAKEVAQQIVGRKLMQAKAPDFVCQNMVFPPKLNLEQSSSQETASYKKNLLQDNCQSLIDITGGFGVDLFYLSTDIEDVTYCEVNEPLSQLAAHNFEQQGRAVAVHNQSGIDFLRQTDKTYDCLFVDPSRRTGKGKIILLEESEPNIVEHWELLLHKAKRVIVKLSPMVDLTYLQDRLSNLVEIHVLAIKQDVKEVLLIAESGFTGEPKLVAATIGGEEVKEYVCGLDRSRTYNEVIEDELDDFSYLYEPYSVLLKAGLQDDYAIEHGLSKIDPNTHLYLSKELIETPMCKRFNILATPSLNKKDLTKLIPTKQVNVVCRNYPLKPEQVLQKLKFKQGGEQTLFCFRAGKARGYLLGERE